MLTINIQLFDFLGSDQVQIRQVATQHVAGLTASHDYHAYFRFQDYKAVKALMDMTKDEPVRYLAAGDSNDNQADSLSQTIAHDAAKALINLSGVPEFVQVMDNETFLNDLILLTVVWNFISVMTNILSYVDGWLASQDDYCRSVLHAPK